VKALWVDRVAPPGFEQSGNYHRNDYEFIPARLADNPIYANDADYRRTLEVLPEHLRKAFLDGDWNVFAGQYFDIFDYGRHTARPEEIWLEAWWPRWISIDWGFQHPSAVYWHCAVPGSAGFQPAGFGGSAERKNSRQDAGATQRIVTYREFVQSGLSPRMLAQGIAERSGRENISEVFLSPDAFAHRTAEASIAEQLGDVLTANGLPRPAVADDDRIGGWQLMYQMLESDAWVITENCEKLIACMPTLVRDVGRVEDIRKMDGDDPADSARYGLVSGGRIAGVAAAFAPSRAGQPPPLKPPGSGAHFVTGMPLAEQIARQVSATDRTSQAIHYQRLEAEARKQFPPKKFPRRQW
jgi:phage terminase large subunit